MCLTAFGLAQAAAFSHLISQNRAHVHTADGETVWVDDTRTAAVDAGRAALASNHPDARALLALVEASASSAGAAASTAAAKHAGTPANPSAPAPIHEARGLAHLAVPFFAVATLVFVPTLSPVAPAIALALPAFAPLEPGRRHDSRGPPATA
jgi:hypothetical protein